MELASKYDPKEVESKWYQYWLDNKLFASKPDGRQPYTIVIPPPNVTGVLHMGHMLNNTIQDILIRRARMEGKNACWVPGTDHASIATEAKVVKKLAEQGIKKRDLTRDEFLKHAWDWTDEHGGIILKQLRRLGASCDWDRTAFKAFRECYQGLRRPLQQRLHLSWPAHGELGPQGPHRPLNRGGYLQRRAEPPVPPEILCGRSRGR